MRVQVSESFSGRVDGLQPHERGHGTGCSLSNAVPVGWAHTTTALSRARDSLSRWRPQPQERTTGSDAVAARRGPVARNHTYARVISPRTPPLPTADRVPVEPRRPTPSAPGTRCVPGALSAPARTEVAMTADDDTFLSPLVSLLSQLVRDHWTAWGYGPSDAPTAVALVRRGLWSSDVVVLYADGSVSAYRAPETFGSVPLCAEYAHWHVQGCSLDRVMAAVSCAQHEYGAPQSLPVDRRPPQTKPWPYSMPSVSRSQVRPSPYLRDVRPVSCLTAGRHRVGPFEGDQ